MIVFTTILPTKEDLSKDEFFNTIIEWNQTSPFEENRVKNIDWDGSYNTHFGEGTLQMEFMEIGDIVAARYENTDNKGVIWRTDSVYNLKDRRIAIRLDRTFSKEALEFNPDFYAPDIVELFIRKGYLANDNNLPVQMNPIKIDDNNVDILKDIILGKTSYNLPVVYISKTIDNHDPVDINELFERIKGTAHILVQDSIKSSFDLLEKGIGNNEFFGTCGIYYPNKAKKSSRIMYHGDGGYDKEQENLIVRNVVEYCNVQDIPSTFVWQGVSNLILNEYLNTETANRVNAEKELGNFISDFDSDQSVLEEKIKRLTKENEALQVENRAYLSRMRESDSRSVLHCGKEKGLFPEEIEEIVLDALTKALADTKENSRRYHVLKDIIESNDYPHNLARKQEKLKILLKNYDGMSSDTIKRLRELGFSVETGGAHQIIRYYDDPRYWNTLASTPSEGRGGKNAASNIIGEMM